MSKKITLAICLLCTAVPGIGLLPTAKAQTASAPSTASGDELAAKAARLEAGGKLEEAAAAYQSAGAAYNASGDSASAVKAYGKAKSVQHRSGHR